MGGRSKLLAAVQTALLRSGRWRPAAAAWGTVYHGLARLWVAYLARGEPRAAGYVRAGIGGGESIVPGVSDIDVAVVLPARAGPLEVGRVAARWRRVRRLGRVADALFDYPIVLEQDELAAAVGASALTYGLGERAGSAAAYFGSRVNPDLIRLLERPGLHGPTGDWRLLRGPDLRPVVPARDRQRERVAAWLELCAWWQWALEACLDPARPSTASLCVKLVAEPARIWLWLACATRVSSRAEALSMAARELPEEAETLARTRALQHALPTDPDPPLRDAISALARFTGRIERLIADELEAHGTTAVRLAGDPQELVLVHGDWHPTPDLAGGGRPALLPLCDWRTLSSPRLLDESFAPLELDPAEAGVLAAAAGSQDYGPYPCLSAGRLMVFAGRRHRTRLRAIKCAASDPVSFALREGHSLAAFPEVPGWSAGDVAARALAEHRAWLRDGPVPDGPEREGVELSMLWSAARVALFAESICASGGEAVLPLTVTATAERLAGGTQAAGRITGPALDAHRRFALDRTPPSAEVLGSMRGLVEELPAYGDQMRSATRGA